VGHNSAFTKEIAVACVEMQSHALAFAKILRTKVAKGSTLEIVKLKQELAVSAKNLKVALNTNLVQND